MKPTRIRSCFFLLALIVWPSIASTENQSRNDGALSADTLSLYAAIRYSLNHNQTVLYAADQSFRSEEARLRSTLSVYNPTLTVGASINRNFTRTETSENMSTSTYAQQILPDLTLGQAFLTPLGSKTRVGVGIQTGIEGFSGFNYTTAPTVSLSYLQPLSLAGIKSGHAEVESARRSYTESLYSFQLQKEDLALAVIQSYFQLWQSFKNVEQNERDYQSTKRVLDIAELKLKSGSIAEFEVINVRVQFRLSEDNLVQVRNTLKTQAVSFLRLLGDATHPLISDSSVVLDPHIPLDSMGIDLDSAISIAYANRVELKRSELGLEQSELDKEQTAAAVSPELQLQAAYNMSSLSELSVVNSLTSLPNYGWQLQATFSVPILDGGRNSAELEIADRNIAVQRKNISLLKEEIAIDIENRYRTLDLDLRRLRSLNSNLKAAEEALRIAELRFQSGQISSTDIESVRNHYNAAQIALNSAKISCVLERAGLARAMGKLFDWIETLRKH